MAQLKESPSLDELRTKYDQVWDHLLRHEEEEARGLIDAFAEQANFHDFKKSEAREFKDYLKTPYPYIAIGIALPVSAFLLVLLLP
ncbi:hypothetical protein [Paenibacillus macerans]|uniref:hypothetical protein n=1 Tax=Paenibacillus macerans TaxID=44252 RepID=UPI003D3221D7